MNKEGRKEGKERRLFLIVEYELTNVEGIIIELENHHLAVTVGIIVSAKSTVGSECEGKTWLVIPYTSVLCVSQCACSHASLV